MKWTLGYLRFFCLVFGILLLSVTPSRAQSSYRLNNKTALEIKDYLVLPDNEFSFSKIQQDITLKFSPDSLLPGKSNAYWVKLKIDNPYPDDEFYKIHIDPILNYALYYPDPVTHRWITRKAGPAVDGTYRNPSMTDLLFTEKSSIVIYLRIELQDIKEYGHAVKPTIILQTLSAFNSQETLLRYFSMACFFALFSFMCYNLYIYFSLNDEAYFYMVLLQIGSLIFLLAVRQYFHILFPYRIYNTFQSANGIVKVYTLNTFFEHVASLLICIAVVQFSRTYLRTRELMPGYDRIMRFAIYTYAVMEAIPSLMTISGLFYMNSYTIVADNILIQAIIVLNVVVAIVAYRRKIRAAKYFLLAFVIPMILSIAASIHVIIYNQASNFLPEFAIMSQVMTFSMALIGRVKLINEELRKKELDALQLEANIRITEAKRTLLEQENQYISLTMATEKKKNTELAERLEANQRELVSNSVYIHQKNTLLSELEVQIQDIDMLYPHLKHSVIKDIQGSLRDSQYLDAEWDKFKLHFERVHPSFFENLVKDYPALTKNDQRLAAYLHIKLSTKEIATLLNILPSSVKQSKARLKAKMKSRD